MKKCVAAIIIPILIKALCHQINADDSSLNEVPLTIYFDAGEDVVKCLELLRINEGKQSDIEKTLHRQDKEITNFKETEKQLNIKLLELSEKLNELNGKSTQSVHNLIESLEKRLLEIENKLKSIDVLVSEQYHPKEPTDVSQMLQRPAERACNRARREIQQIHPNATALSELSYLAKIGKNASVSGSFKLTCIGALIDKRFVIATAHCLEETKPTTVKLGIFGRNVLIARDYTVQKNIQNIQIHPQYSDRHRNNIGLIELDSEVTYSTLIYPICLYTAVDKPETGFAMLNPTRDGKLYPLNIEIAKKSKCIENSGDFVFCALISYEDDLNCTSIKGPLVWRENESVKDYRLIGLPASYSNVCDRIFEATNITMLLNFVESIVWAS